MTMSSSSNASGLQTMPKFPPFVRFHPTDEEIIRDILHTLVVKKQPLPRVCDHFVHRLDLFGTTSEPSEIWDIYRGDEFNGSDLLFLSEVKRKGKKQLERKIGRKGGTWSQTEGFKNVMSSRSHEIIGQKRKFRFENKGLSEDHEKWLLDEYSSELCGGDGGGGEKCSKNGPVFVMCRMRRNLLQPPAPSTKQ